MFRFLLHIQTHLNFIFIRIDVYGMENILIHAVFFLTAKGAVQKEVVCFGLSKEEAVVLQRPAGEDFSF